MEGKQTATIRQAPDALLHGAEAGIATALALEVVDDGGEGDKLLGALRAVVQLLLVWAGVSIIHQHTISETTNSRAGDWRCWFRLESWPKVRLQR